MSENTIQTAELPPSPAPTAAEEPENIEKPPHELFPASEPTPAAKIDEKIQSATGGLFEKFGWKRGKGRPRNDGTPKISDRPIVARPVAGPSPVADGPPEPAKALDAVFVRRCVATVGKTITGFIERQLFTKAVAATNDQEFAKELVKQTTATPGEIDALGELTDLLLKEMGINSKHLPLICLCTTVAGAGARYAVAFQSLNKQLAQRNNIAVLQPEKK